MVSLITALASTPTRADRSDVYPSSPRTRSPAKLPYGIARRLRPGEMPSRPSRRAICFPNPEMRRGMNGQNDVSFARGTIRPKATPQAWTDWLRHSTLLTGTPGAARNVLAIHVVAHARRRRHAGHTHRRPLLGGHGKRHQNQQQRGRDERLHAGILEDCGGEGGK